MKAKGEAFDFALPLIVSGTHNHTGWHPIPRHIICSLADHQLALLHA